jgi:hypothetical protein
MEMIKAREWNLMDCLKTEEDIYYYLEATKLPADVIGISEECAKTLYPDALKNVAQARIVNNIPEPTSYEYNFNEFEPENYKELSYV